MKPSTAAIIRDTFNASNEGRIHFGQVVDALLQAEVESYHVDYRAHRITCYAQDGKTLTLDTTDLEVEITQTFSNDQVKAAIHGAQRGDIMYPEFKRRSQMAGCVGYTAWLTGRHVTYFGRNGEQHIERFPD